ncbi:hypothetical protein [Mucilaginibacter celer]|uniref:SMI1/KNR4 family protein n=1 Tax=Mucilaginibacter celer TaxID=2305508 RepID=A0A494VR37_9SPHI|nr:hypothetical protein [Mucilaginibacter celer]AYL93798.1 hypothetical protein HYN43_000140 [Mucilaginibacter celer]
MDLLILKLYLLFIELNYLNVDKFKSVLRKGLFSVDIIERKTLSNDKMEQLELLLNKYRFERRSQSLEQCILEAIPFQLPGDYKFYLKNYEPFEGPMGSQYVQFWKTDELLENNQGYGILNISLMFSALGVTVRASL